MKQQRPAIVALIALLIAAAHIFWRHSEHPSRSPVVMAGQQRMQTAQRPTYADTSYSADIAQHSNFQSVILDTVVNVPAESVLIVGSLDQYARRHKVQLSLLNQIETHAPTAKMATHNKYPEYESWWGRYQSQQIQPEPTKSVDVELLSEHRRFLVPFFRSDSERTSRPVMARRIASGQRVAVYADEDLVGPIIDFSAQQIVELIEAGLLSFVETHVRPIIDLDHNDCVTFCITNLVSDRDSELFAEPVHGCVRASDFCVAEGSTSPLAGDIVYLDAELPTGGNLAALLAHEITHAAVYSAFAEVSEKPSRPKSESRIRSITFSHGFGRMPITELPSIPAWLNEGIAHVIERRVFRNSVNLHQRFRSFHEFPTEAPLVIPDFTLRESRRGASRAAACSFLEFQFRTQPNFLQELAKGPGGIERMSEICGRPFETLFQNWSESLVTQTAAYKLKSKTSITLAGTATCHFMPSTQARRIKIQAPAECECQVTVLNLTDRTTVTSLILRKSDQSRTLKLSTAGHGRIIQ